MNQHINGVVHIPITREDLAKKQEDAAAMVARDVAMIPAAAAELATWTTSSSMTVAAIVDFLVDYAPVMTKSEEAKSRKRAEKAATKARKSGEFRGYVSTSDEMSRRADIEARKAVLRTNSAAAREFAEEESGAEEAFANGVLDYAALMDRPPLRPLIDGVMNLDTVAMLYAPPATFKTFLSLWWAVCVALGHRWAGRDVAQGPVLYIAAEGVAGIQKRVAALSWLLNGGKPIPDFYIYPSAVDLTNPSESDEIRAFVAEHGVVFTVADTTVKVAGGADENDNTAMTQLTNAAEKIRRAHDGSTFLFVHHSGKSGDYRGASALLGNVDTMLKLDGEAGMLTLAAVKQKDGVDGEIVRLHAKPVPEHDTLVLEVLAPGQGQPAGILQARVEEALAHFVRAFGETGASRAQFVDLLVDAGTAKKSTAQNYVGDLIKSGRLIATANGARGTRLDLAPQLTTFPTD